jgi:hypothetical protein
MNPWMARSTYFWPMTFGTTSTSAAAHFTLELYMNVVDYDPVASALNAGYGGA